ncbi:MAG: RIP metalloprotease RseP [Patescibacteria group bacterium]|nr:RIP metalloprotease RseP [Patescibacteria group bacterium]
MFVTIIIFLVVLSLLVFVHEFGHFFAARRLGVRAEEFGFGFPPRLWGMYKNKEGKWKRVWGRKEITDSQDTVYSINAIPLGGFVKIKGENGDGKEDKDSFVSKKPWRRAIILSAGVFMNIVLASVLISIGLMIGFPQSINKDVLPKSAKISNEKVQVVQIVPDSPAVEAGLEPADVLLSINGEAVLDANDVEKIINSSDKEELTVIVSRFGEIRETSLIPKLLEEENRKIIGVAISQTAIVQYPWYSAIWEGLKMTGQLLWAIIYAFYEIIRNLIISQPINAEVAGPIGIAELTGQMARMGIIYLIQFTALLSLNLAIINFLPFPALDGGRLIFLLIEKIKGRPVKKEVEAVFHNLGFMLLMVLVLWVTIKDVVRLFN